MLPISDLINIQNTKEPLAYSHSIAIILGGYLIFTVKQFSNNQDRNRKVLFYEVTEHVTNTQLKLANFPLSIVNLYPFLKIVVDE